VALRLCQRHDRKFSPLLAHNGNADHRADGSAVWGEPVGAATCSGRYVASRAYGGRLRCGMLRAASHHKGLPLDKLARLAARGQLSPEVLRILRAYQRALGTARARGLERGVARDFGSTAVDVLRVVAAGKPISSIAECRDDRLWLGELLRRSLARL
jgi:hypothetical protein